MSCELFLYPHTCSPDACLGEHYYIHLSVHQMRFSVIIISLILGGGYPQSYLHSSPSKTSSSADDTLFRFLQAHQTKPGGYGLTRGDEGQRYLNSRAVHKQIVWKRFQVAASDAYWRRDVTWYSRRSVIIHDVYFRHYCVAVISKFYVTSSAFSQLTIYCCHGVLRSLGCSARPGQKIICIESRKISKDGMGCESK